MCRACFERRRCSDANGKRLGRGDAPELAQRIRQEKAEPPCRLPEKAPVVLYGALTENDLPDLWLEQLRDRLGGLSPILGGDRRAINDWLCYQDASRDRLGFFRAVQARDTLLEVKKLARFLSGPREVLRVEKGKGHFR